MVDHGICQESGGTELPVILLIVLVLFGSSRLTGLARSIGASAKELRRGLDTATDADPVDAE